MHACGHDMHVSMLASAARLLSENTSEFAGKIRFMFQPGEEGYHGAKYMIEEGVLDGVDRAFAIHVTSSVPNGLIGSRGGPLLASADRFEITVLGGGGHASAPHNCIDPIPPAAAMVGGFQTIVTRDLDPNQSAVITVAHIEAGTTNNIIPPSAFLEGTIRTFDEDVRATVHEGIERVSTNIAAAHKCGCIAKIIPGYPVTINDQEQTELAASMTQKLLGAEGFLWMENPIFAAEDFSYVLNQVPGAMAMMGACPDDVSPEDAEPNHSNLVRFNESALYNGVGLYAAMAMAG
jgi:amidohydrolase